MSYFPETCSKDKTKRFDLSNYATKSDFAIGADTSDFIKKYDLAGVKLVID